ncbi:MAG: hypothetical protein F6K31_19090 [Symploca sp. SIO2G7]|nr:hypothetical protein [Symploca sp. SIO2G7]
MSFVICHLSFVICHWSLVIGHLLFVIGHWSLVIGDKLNGRAFCQLPYMEFVYSPKHAYMEITQGIRKMVIPLPHLPISASGASRVPASGASLDNDIFTLTCYKWSLVIT